ncbi:hypothetical protein Vadar_008883 [Vaccinium darrowii]|uniref:Uncharacterized protein n=1 Tax=Vaccinium darrowii TaxID=229202 RepID=A0ACB7YDL0_9ERIC|nr:hypothetical protein Vadar_008883 [Vaccinium darrowii]
MDDDDLVFYALKGLPSEFKPVRSALTAKGDVLFDELATILKNEESQLVRDEALGSAKVFLTTSQSISHEASGTRSQMVSNPNPSVVQPGLLGAGPQYYHAPMYQNSHEQNGYFPVQTGRNVNNGGSQRQKGGRGVPYGQNNKIECQICGKTNHTAFFCYNRQNLQYQPPQYSPSFQGQSSRRGQSWSGQQNSQQTWQGQQISQRPYFNGSGNQFGGSGGFLVTQPQPQANVLTYSGGYTASP